VTLYLDTSSLVKLYVAEPGSDDVLARRSQASRRFADQMSARSS